MKPRHVLILGGTGEARRLAETLVSDAALRVTLSLAGRTANPRPQPCETRVGGFGGTEGLAGYIRENGVDIVVDATHPFAARISTNAERAVGAAAVPLVVLERPAWRPVAGDTWIDAASVADAARLLGTRPRTVFLAIGRQEVAAFAGLPHAFIVRSVDPVDPGEAPARARFIVARGPFDMVAERALFEAEGVEIVVAKNSGGEATYGKIAAARALGLPVVMVRRPRAAAADGVATVEAAVERIRHLAALPAARGE